MADSTEKPQLKTYTDLDIIAKERQKTRSSLPPVDITDSIIHMDISKVEPDFNQPRKYFNETTLDELKNSIKENGVKTPIVVRPIPNGKYKIVSGERRWRACGELQFKTIPVIIRQLDDSHAFFDALTENIQRDEMHFLDEAVAYKYLLDRGMASTQAEIGKILGVQQQRISDKLKLMSLPVAVKEVIINQNPAISERHARFLSEIKDEKKCYKLALKIVTDQLTTRHLEVLIAHQPQTKQPQDKNLKSSFKAVKFDNIGNGFNLTVKFRKDRLLEDGDKIISTLTERVEFLKNLLKSSS